MRHDKIIPTDDVALPLLETGAEDGVSGEDADKEAPPVAQQHFWFCGRTTSRDRSPIRRH